MLPAEMRVFEEVFFNESFSLTKCGAGEAATLYKCGAILVSPKQDQ